MPGHRRTKPCRQNSLFIVPVLAGVLAIAVIAAWGGPAPAQPPDAAPVGQTAAERFKNIQVLKGIPADELIPSMQFISGSLGVDCSFCHVEGADKRLEFDKDDKKQKKTAREMMQMMFAIDKDNFKGEREVTCNTCHQGSPHPQAIPAVMIGAPPSEASHQHATDPASLPSGAPVIEKFLAALGGRAVLEKISTRVETGQAVIPEAPALPITIYSKAPDLRVSAIHTPKGESLTAYNGHVGWLSSPGRPPRAMSAADQLAARLDAVAFFPTYLEHEFAELKLEKDPEKIGNEETDLVLGIKPGQPTVKLYFDRSSGYLVRLLHYTSTPLGLLPTQVDFADYRDAGGVKVPRRWTIARPSGSFTIQIEKVEQNVAIDDARFVEPKFAPPSEMPGHAPSSEPQGPKPPQGSTPQGGAATPAPGGILD